MIKLNKLQTLFYLEIQKVGSKGLTGYDLLLRFRSYGIGYSHQHIYSTLSKMQLDIRNESKEGERTKIFYSIPKGKTYELDYENHPIEAVIANPIPEFIEVKSKEVLNEIKQEQVDNKRHPSVKAYRLKQLNLILEILSNLQD
ncbi:hypothetical protein [Vibrio astriarenae]|uniref:hypothetical protein n=1 Tax=Vibrio astriarenae TaxID=1481923 RepID=UPI0037357EC7